MNSSAIRIKENTLNKIDYLNDTNGFTNYIRELRDQNLTHSYEVTFPQWRRKLREEGKSDRVLQQGNKVLLQLNSLSDALDEYFWPTSNGLDTSFQANNILLGGMSQKLQAALDGNNDNETFLQCINILDWGGTYKGSVRWLVERHEAGRLVTDIRRAVEILDGNTRSDNNAFDLEPGSPDSLRMDAGLTKIYSLASKESIIYDDRVGAALGLLARKYIESGEQPQNEVPPELDFMRGRSEDRNPSNGTLQFQGRGTNPSAVHARSNLIANWIVGEVAKKLGNSWDRREVEAALFTIGYRVRNGAAGDR